MPNPDVQQMWDNFISRQRATNESIRKLLEELESDPEILRARIAALTHQIEALTKEHEKLKAAHEELVHVHRETCEKLSDAKFVSDYY